MKQKEVEVYRGGQHYVVCNGKEHYRIIPDWNKREYDGACWCVRDEERNNSRARKGKNERMV